MSERSAWGPISGLRNVAYAVVLTVVLQVPTTAEIYRHDTHHHPAALSAAVLLLTVAGVAVVLERASHWPALRRWASSGWVTAVLLGVLTAVGVLTRRYEEGLYRQGKGASQALAMIRPAEALIHGSAMYGVVLPGGIHRDPISPGPLWVIVNAPFSLLHGYALVTPFWVALLVIGVRSGLHRRFEANLGLFLLLLSPHLAQEMADGEDTVALTCALISLTVVTQRRLSRRTAVPIGLAAGVLATGRIIYIGFPVLLALFAWRRDRLAASAVAVVGVAVALAAHLVAAIGVHPYQPAHLFSRAASQEPTWNIVVGAVVSAAVVVAASARVRATLTSWLVWLAVCVTVPHAFIALGELEGSHGALATWEGSNYLMVGSALVLAAVIAVRTSGSDVRAPVPRPTPSARPSPEVRPA